MSARARWWLACFVSGVAGFSTNSNGFAQAPASPPARIAPPNDFGKQYSFPQPKALDAQTDNTIRSVTARSQFGVDGTGLTIAVLDTGLRTTHVDFAGKVLAVRNFTTDDGGNANTVTDGSGHGTNVAGVAIGSGLHTGIAPGAKVVALKVLTNSGGGSFSSVQQALDWVIQNRTTHKITVVNMSLGDGGNYTTDPSSTDPVRQRIASLRAAGVAVCVAAGNDFYRKGSRQGMSYPAICRESISVGALYDANLGRITYGDGATAYSTAAKVVTPFSQRLHSSVNATTKTDVFVPGAALTAAGNANDTAESTYHGTSQATPVTAGLCLLAQQYALKKTGNLPTVDQLEKWLTATSTAAANTITDGDDESDNVTNTNKQFVMADAVEMLAAAERDLTGGGSGGGSTTSAVTATYKSVPPTLTVTGDGNPASLSISRSGSRVTITAGAGTLINGGSTATFSTATSITLAGDLGGGDDLVSLLSLQLSNLNLKLGAGNDRLTLSYCTVTTSRVDGGAGTDAFISSTSTIKSNQNLGFP